jgi:hypothetical protein
MIDLAWIAQRCTEDEDTGCMVWGGTTNPSGAPTATPKRENGRKPTLQLRRIAWQERHGEIPEGMLVTYSCKNPRCLRHLELVTKAEVVRRQWQKTDARAKLTAGATRASRKRAKLDMDRAREIRNSNETLEVIAARMGISVALASQVRRGERWKDDTNPFGAMVRSVAANDERKAA